MRGSRAKVPDFKRTEPSANLLLKTHYWFSCFQSPNFSTWPSWPAGNRLLPCHQLYCLSSAIGAKLGHLPLLMATKCLPAYVALAAQVTLCPPLPGETHKKFFEVHHTRHPFREIIPDFPHSDERQIPTTLCSYLLHSIHLILLSLKVRATAIATPVKRL